MKKEIILTEDPNKELWNQFKRFENIEVCLNYYQVLENKNTNLIKSIDFNLEDLLSFIPELNEGFENIFNKKSLAIKVDRIKDEDGEYLFYEGDYFADYSILNDFFNNIPNFDKYYLPPLVSPKDIVCFKRPQSNEDIVLRNIMGEEFLVSSLQSSENFIYLSQITVHFLILYLLSMLSRYYVNLWLNEKSSEETRYFT